MGRVFLLLLALALPVVAEEGYPIVQGASGGGTAQFAVLVGRADVVRFAVKPGGGGAALPPAHRVSITEGDAPGRVERVIFEGLATGTDHELFVIRDRKVVDRRAFRIPDWTRNKGRIAVASCMDDHYEKEQAKIWGELLAEKPDAIVLIGDCCYSDFYEGRLVRQAPPGILWRRQAETRSKLAVFRSPRLVPVFTVWDDHDFGMNNAGRDYVHKRASKRVFRAFFPQEEIDGFLNHGPGVSATFVLFGQRWVLLDGRSFRSPNRKPVEDETVFGPAQDAWLLRMLAGTTPTWIVNGAQFFGAYHRFESYEGCQPKSFARFKRSLVDRRAPFAFVSGDRHLAEIMRIEAGECGLDTIELTTSAIHARTFPDAWKDAPNPRQVQGVSGTLNYAMLDVERAEGLKAGIRVLGLDRKLHFRHDIDIRRGAAR